MKQTFVIHGGLGWTNVFAQIWAILSPAFAAGHSASVTVSTSDKPTDVMRRKWHAMCGDIARHAPDYKGAAMNLERWKAVCMAAAIEQEWLPAWEGNGVVPFRKSSENLSKKQYCDCIEVAYAIGSRLGVEWSAHDER